MSSHQHRNFEAAPADSEALESLRHMTSWARKDATTPEAAPAPASSTLGFFAESFALGASAFYPGFHAIDLPHEVDIERAQPKTHRPSRTVVAARAVGGAARWLWQGFQHRREAARATALLAKMDDRSLQDIGLTRADIDRAARHGRDWDRWR